MTREHYPERIPFRLTRMLIAAMEVSGIEGNYRSTCDSVMKVLREVCGPGGLRLVSCARVSHFQRRPTSSVLGT